MVKYPVRKGFKRIGVHKFCASGSLLQSVVPVYCNIERGEYLLVYADEDYRGTDLASLKQKVAKDGPPRSKFAGGMEAGLRFEFRVVQIAFDDNDRPVRERQVLVDAEGNIHPAPASDRPYSRRMDYRASFTKDRYFKLVHVRDFLQQLRKKLDRLVPAGNTEDCDVLDSFETPIHIAVPETSP